MLSLIIQIVANDSELVKSRETPKQKKYVKSHTMCTNTTSIFEYIEFVFMIFFKLVPKIRTRSVRKLEKDRLYEEKLREIARAAGIVECFVKLVDIKKCTTQNNGKKTNVNNAIVQPDRIRSLAPWLPRQPELTRSNLVQENVPQMQTFLNEMVLKSK